MIKHVSVLSEKEKAERDWCTSHEAAEMLWVSPPTVLIWTHAGHLKCIRTPGRHRRYLKKDIYALKKKMGG